MNKKLTFRAAAAIGLAAVMAAAAILAGCGNSDNATPDEAKKETRVVTETQVVTRVVDGFYTDENGNVIKDDDGQPISAPAGTPDTDTNQGGNNNSSAAENKSGESSADNKAGGNSSSAGNGSESKSSKSSSSSASSSSSSKSSGNSDKSSPLTLGGKTFKVGDKVTCTYTLTCKKLMSNFQALVNYDGNCLKAVNAYLDGPAKSGSVINYELENQIKFNGINLNGYNYTKGADFLVVEYEVVGGGSTAPEFVWQIATDVKDNALVKNGKPDAAITLSESYS